MVEAAARSGALNTAHHALQLGRPVFAVPGAFASAASVGCHRLVADGVAQIVVTPRDPVAAALAQEPGGCAGPDVRNGADAPVDPGVPSGRGGRTPRAVLDTASDPHVRRAVDALEGRARSVVEVARRSGLSVDDAADALALAQLAGAAEPAGDGWRRC